MIAAPRPSGWSLRELLGGLVTVPSEWERTVSGLATDSRTTRPGDVFFARQGLQTSGEHFVDAALAAGAVAVVREGSMGDVKMLRGAVPAFCVPDVCQALGQAADRFYDHPSRRLRVIGVTGTNGKTSVAHFVARSLHLWSAMTPPAPCGIIGTVGYGLYGELRAGGHTTPDGVMTHALLAEMASIGARHAVMEVSSHGLEQGRVAGVRFDTAVFTNLSHDHLDYHGGMDAYGRAKARLFHSPGLRCAVINVDDPFGHNLLDELPAEVEPIACSLAPEGKPADPGAAASRRRATRLVGRVVGLGRDRLRLAVATPWGEAEVATSLLGRFNAANLLAALGALLGSGVALDAAVARLAAVEPVPGRMQPFGGTSGTPLVVVDYAHTPDALRNALQALREHCRGALWCVLGCGGDRDRGKRPLMGAIAAAEADRVIVTDDNPRHEDGTRIVEEILSGIPRGITVRVERDRATAIRDAIGAGVEGDVVLIAGKGHEPYQEIAGVRHPFSDAAAVNAALEERGA